jgi:hypothetical protein
MKIHSNLLFIGTFAILSSCSPKLAGTWNIEKYEVNEAGKSTVSVANIGSITFDKDNSGVKNVHYAIFQNEYNDKSPFKWHRVNENTISIEGEASDLTKSWLIISNERKQQVWKSTDGATKVQTLTLTR